MKLQLGDFFQNGEIENIETLRFYNHNYYRATVIRNESRITGLRTKVKIHTKNEAKIQRKQFGCATVVIRRSQTHVCVIDIQLKLV